MHNGGRKASHHQELHPPWHHDTQILIHGMHPQACRDPRIGHHRLNIKQLQTLELLLDSSSLTDSWLHQTKITNCSMDNCSVTYSPLAFRRFLPEIRAMIFSRCVSFRNFKTPVLLVALRCHPELYQEAIAIFYKRNWFHFKLQTLPDLESMSRNAIGHIQKLLI
jgi:hypothetical protein